VRSGGPGEARTILLLHIISARPSKQPLMVRTFLKVYMELGSYFVSARTNKRHHHLSRSSFYFLPVKSQSSTGQAGRSCTDSELLFHRTKLNFAGGQRDCFIIMITKVPVRSHGPRVLEYYSYSTEAHPNHDLPCSNASTTAEFPLHALKSQSHGQQAMHGPRVPRVQMQMSQLIGPHLLWFTTTVV
jgi:hypothetical protein